MTSEAFSDALTLLPEDLLARADEFRSRKPTVIPLKRYAALAACFAVLLTSAIYVHSLRQKSAVTEMAAAVPFDVMEDAEAVEEAPRMEAAAVPSCPMVETPDLPNTAEIDHSAAIITSRSELEGYFTEMGRYYQLDALRDVCALYDETWFSNSDLLLIPVDSVSPSCSVTDVTLADGVCVITITGEETEAGTNFHLVLPVEKDSVTDTKNITVIYNSDTTD